MKGRGGQGWARVGRGEQGWAGVQGRGAGRRTQTQPKLRPCLRKFETGLQESKENDL